MKYSRFKNKKRIILVIMTFVLLSVIFINVKDENIKVNTTTQEKNVEEDTNSEQVKNKDEERAEKQKEEKAIEEEKQKEKDKTETKEGNNKVDEPIVTNNVEATRKPILVFIDDDSRIETYSYWKRLAQEENVRISLAVPTNWVENGISQGTYAGKTSMTKAQLRELYNMGFDCLSHGYNSETIGNLLDDPNRLSQELVKSQEWLINNGFTRNQAYKYFVYPQGNNGSRALEVKAKVRENYIYGINAFTGEENISGAFDSYNIPRVSGDGQSAKTLKAELDKVISNKGIMIVLSHAWHITDQDGGNYDIWSSRYKALITYARANNVEILPFSEAINKY